MQRSDLDTVARLVTTSDEAYTAALRLHHQTFYSEYDLSPEDVPDSLDTEVVWH